LQLQIQIQIEIEIKKNKKNKRNDGRLGGAGAGGGSAQYVISVCQLLLLRIEVIDGLEVMTSHIGKELLKKKRTK
jgi:hypothetical protein